MLGSTTLVMGKDRFYTMYLALEVIERNFEDQSKQQRGQMAPFDTNQIGQFLVVVGAFQKLKTNPDTHLKV